MKLIVLGSGTGVPSLVRNAPGYFIEALGQEFLVDCGSGSLLQMERAGKHYRPLDAVFMTHTHPDHIGDLIPLIHALKITPGFRREKPLKLFGPAGLAAFYHDCIAPVVTKPKHFEVQITEVATPWAFGGLNVRSAPTVHSDKLQSVAYRFEADHRSLVLSGDCDYDSALVDLSQAADLLVLDCSFPDALKVKGHLSASECGRVAREAKVKKLLLSHLYPTAAAEDTRVMECRTVFEGDVQLAEDLMELEI